MWTDKFVLATGNTDNSDMEKGQAAKAATSGAVFSYECLSPISEGCINQGYPFCFSSDGLMSDEADVIYVIITAFL